jgi:hypothetical protein
MYEKDTYSDVTFFSEKKNVMTTEFPTQTTYRPRSKHLYKKCRFTMPFIPTLSNLCRILHVIACCIYIAARSRTKNAPTYVKAALHYKLLQNFEAR